MIILKAPENIPVRRFKCRLCNCEFLAEAIEAHIYDDHWEAFCPICRNPCASRKALTPEKLKEARILIEEDRIRRQRYSDELHEKVKDATEKLQSDAMYQELKRQHILMEV